MPGPPNPCVVCNNEIKFRSLLKKALELDADYIATGHYAIVEHNVNGKQPFKKRTKDVDKDQTYMLYGLTQFQLSHTLMPLGNYTKQEVRQMAKDFGFRIHNKPESQEICFVPDNNYTRFLDENYPGLGKPGPVMDTDGNILGKHKGLHHYTIGQRRGLGISLGYPVYVVKLDREKNAVIIGPEEEVYSKSLIANKVNWISIDKLTEPIKVTARIRYNSPESHAKIYPVNDNEVKVVFDKKQRAVTPGQSVVFL